jgi:hypothetical protein
MPAGCRYCEFSSSIAHALFLKFHFLALQPAVIRYTQLDACGTPECCGN